MPTFGDLSKYKQNPNAYTVSSYTPQQKYSLTDLRKDEEFNKVTERFLTSLGEGETVGDLFGYFRGADYNLGDATKMVFESGKFTDQQKTDYQYLRGKFDNADVGGFGEWVRAGANVTKEIITDPTMIVSALFIPWTGGVSAAARIASGKAVQATLKKLANKNIAEGVSKKVAKLPGQTLKAPMSKTAQTVAASTEGFVYGSTANFTKQHADVNTDRREEIKPEESLAMGAITAAIPFALRGAGVGYTKFNNSIANRRAARIDGNEDYKVGILDKGIEKTDALIDYVTPNMRKLTGFVNKPTTILLNKMEESKILDGLVKYFRYDAARSINAKDYNVAQKVSNRSFYEDVNALIGFRSNQLRKILDPLKTRGTVTVPKFGSRDAFFKIPFRDAPKAERQSFIPRQRIADNVNDALAYYLRTGRKTVTVDGKQIKLEQAFKLTDKSTDDIITAGQSIKKLMTEIRNDAKKEGLEIGLIKNYLPRSFSYSEVKAEIKNLQLDVPIEGKLTKELKAKEGLKNNDEVIKLLEEINNPSTIAGKSYSELATTGKGATRGAYFSKRTPALTKERTLKNIDENNIVDYLDNNVENLLNDYVHQSSSFIQRKAGLGEDLDEFITRFIKPIQEELASKGKKLTSKEIKRLEDIYLVTTGQVQQIDTPFMRTLSDIAVVGNQLALLPMATITSLSEVAVPLVRGAGKKAFQKGKTESGVDAGGVRILWDTAGDYRKMWWNDIVKKDIADARPESLKELNRFNRAMNRAGEDRSLAMYGQGFGRRATQAQNKFFKINLLHDWTRFVQLTSFNVGKAKMYENLHELVTNKNLNKARKTRLTNELKELGVDVTAGKRWVQSGGKASGKFYDENFLPSAARYVDEVIMNPTAAANQKPLWHSMPSTRWAFGLMGFPTAFSNTVLKNAAREVVIDMKTKSLRGTTRALSGATVMTAIAMFGNTIRSNGKNLEALESGEKDIGDEVLDAAIRTGLLGPTEQLYRTQRGLEYDNFARSVVQRFTGPAVDDVYRFFEDWTGPLSFAVDEIPGIALLRSTNPEAYKEIKDAAKKADQAMGLTRKTKPKKEKEKVSIPLYSTGGMVKGEDNVPYTKENPANRINPFTGEPYTALYYNTRQRKPVNKGGRIGYTNGTPDDPTFIDEVGQKVVKAAKSLYDTTRAIGDMKRPKEVLKIIDDRSKYITTELYSPTDEQQQKIWEYTTDERNQYTTKTRAMEQELEQLDKYRSKLLSDHPQNSVETIKDYISLGVQQAFLSKFSKLGGAVPAGTLDSWASGRIIEGELADVEIAESYAGETPLLPSLYEPKRLEERALDLGEYGEYNKFLRNIQAGQEKGPALQLLKAATGQKSKHPLTKSELEDMGLYDLISKTPTLEEIGKTFSGPATTIEELLRIAKARSPDLTHQEYYPEINTQGRYTSTIESIDPVDGTTDYSIIEADDILVELNNAIDYADETKSYYGQDIAFLKFAEDYGYTIPEEIHDLFSMRNVGFNHILTDFDGVNNAANDLTEAELEKLFNDTTKNITPDKLSNLAENIARLRFYNDPYIHITPDLATWEVDNVDMEWLSRISMYGSENTGWNLIDKTRPFKRNKPSEAGDPFYGDAEAAQFALQDYIRNVGVIDEERTGEMLMPAQGINMGTLPDPQEYFEFMVKETGEEDTYQTKGYRQKPEHWWQDEYNAENAIGWAQLSTRKLADGSESQHAEAIQSDLQQAANSADKRGLRTGYKSDRERDMKAVTKHLETVLKDFEITSNPIEQFADTLGTNRFMFKNIKGTETMKDLVKDIIVDESLEGDMREANIDASFGDLKRHLFQPVNETLIIQEDQEIFGDRVDWRNIENSLSTPNRYEKTNRIKAIESYKETRKGYSEENLKKLARAHIIKQTAKEILSSPMTTRNYNTLSWDQSKLEAMPEKGDQPIPVNNRYYYDMDEAAIPDLPMKDGEWRKSIWKQSINRGIQNGKTKFSWSPAWIQKIHWFGSGNLLEKGKIHEVADEDLKRLSKKLAKEYAEPQRDTESNKAYKKRVEKMFRTEQLIITEAEIKSGNGGLNEVSRMTRLLKEIADDPKKGDFMIDGEWLHADIIANDKLNLELYLDRPDIVTEIRINVPVLDLTGKAANRWKRLGYSMAKGGLVQQMQGLGLA